MCHKHTPTVLYACPHTHTHIQLHTHILSWINSSLLSLKPKTDRVSSASSVSPIIGSNMQKYVLILLMVGILWLQKTLLNQQSYYQTMISATRYWPYIFNTILCITIWKARISEGTYYSGIRIMFTLIPHYQNYTPCHTKRSKVSDIEIFRDINKAVKQFDMHSDIVPGLFPYRQPQIKRPWYHVSSVFCLRFLIW